MSIDPNRFKRDSREELRQRPMMHGRHPAPVLAPPVKAPEPQAPVIVQGRAASQATQLPAPQIDMSQQTVQAPQAPATRPYEPVGYELELPIEVGAGHNSDDYENVDWTAGIAPATPADIAIEPAPQSVEASEDVPVRRSLARSLAYGIVVFVLFIGSIAAGVMSGKPPQQATVATAPRVLSEQSSGSSDIKLSVGSDSSLSQGTNTGSPMVKQYTETFEGSELNVVVQVAPDNFKEDPSSALKQLATGLKATTVVSTQAWGAGYLRTDDTGAQVVVFANDKYMVVVQSKQSVVLDNWRSYVENFKI